MCIVAHASPNASPKFTTDCTSHRSIAVLSDMHAAMFHLSRVQQMRHVSGQVQQPLFVHACRAAQFSVWQSLWLSSVISSVIPCQGVSPTAGPHPQHEQPMSGGSENT
jgi:hypothetical protein